MGLRILAREAGLSQFYTGLKKGKAVGPPSRSEALGRD
jgi:hypothetical protein